MNKMTVVVTRPYMPYRQYKECEIRNYNVRNITVCDEKKVGLEIEAYLRISKRTVSWFAKELAKKYRLKETI